MLNFLRLIKVLSKYSHLQIGGVCSTSFTDTKANDICYGLGFNHAVDWFEIEYVGASVILLDFQCPFNSSSFVECGYTLDIKMNGKYQGPSNEKFLVLACLPRPGGVKNEDL